MNLDFHGMTDVIALWLVSGLTMTVIVGAAGRRLRNRLLHRIRSNEQGGVYAISLVLVLPLFVTLLATFVECSQLLLARLGLGYAAVAAVRSAVVWEPIDKHWPDTEARLRARCQLAAARTLAPFAICADPHPGVSQQQLPSQQFVAAYARTTARRVANPEYLTDKLANAYAALTVHLDSESSESNHSLAFRRATVTYDAPFLLPGTGRLLGGIPATTPSENGSVRYIRQMCGMAILPVEQPLAIGSAQRDYSLGIRYGEPQ